MDNRNREENEARLKKIREELDNGNDEELKNQFSKNELEDDESQREAEDASEKGEEKGDESQGENGDDEINEVLKADRDELDPEDKKTPEKKEENDYHKKYVDSTRESLALLEQNKKFADTVTQARDIQDISVDDLKAELSKKGIDYEELDANSRTLWKTTIINEKRFGLVDQAVQETRDAGTWFTKVGEFLSDNETAQKFPQVIGREKDFQNFALQQSKRGLAMSEVVALWSYGKPELKLKNKGSLFNTGSAGKDGEEKKAGLSVDTIANIRKTNHKEYKRLIKSGAASKALADL